MRSYIVKAGVANRDSKSKRCLGGGYLVNASGILLESSASDAQHSSRTVITW